jgi:general secretion pathway protein I
MKTRQTQRACRIRRTRRAFSLLEIILAIAIFTMALVAVGELMRLGLRNAQKARDTTRAQLLCESIVAEVTSGAIEPTPVADQASEIDPDWCYSIQVNSTDVTGLLSVSVTVNRVNYSNPLEGVTLVRWMPDPQYAAEIEAAAAATSEATTSSTQTTTSPTTGTQ